MHNVIETIINEKLIAIVRNVAPADMVATAKALYQGGFRILEITFDQSSTTGLTDTATSIALIREVMADSLLVGAGTVMTKEQVAIAKDAGAAFCLSPNTDTTIIKAICDASMVAIPGAYTPSEIVCAYQSGAPIVKLFPAGLAGLDYLKAIRGPINHIPLMAVGGIDDSNVSLFLNNGCCSAGIGSNVVKTTLIKRGNFDELTKVAKKFTDAIREFR